MGFNSFHTNLLLDPGSVLYDAVKGLVEAILNRAQYRAIFLQAVAGNDEGYYRYRQAPQTGFQGVVGLKRLEKYRAVADLHREPLPRAGGSC